MATKTKTAKKTTLAPLDDRVVVLPDTADERTASGIYLPEAAKEKPQTGKVVAVGPGKLTDTGERGKLSVKKGDTVLYGKYAGSEVDVDGVEHKIMRESELLAIIEK
ncbi:MAG: co-chaperone GroES [Phycisphaeraceae bacterium]